MEKRTVIKILIAIAALSVAIMLMFNKQANDMVETASGPIFTSQAECEEVTAMECDFSNCDYVPEGKSYEEVCEGVGKQWLPILDQK